MGVVSTEHARILEARVRRLAGEVPCDLALETNIQAKVTAMWQDHQSVTEAQRFELLLQKEGLQSGRCSNRALFYQCLKRQLVAFAES